MSVVTQHKKRQSSVSQALGRSGKFLARSTLNCYAIIFVELMKAVKASHSTGKTRSVVLWRIKSDTSTRGNFYEMQVHKPAAHKLRRRVDRLCSTLSLSLNQRILTERASNWRRTVLLLLCEMQIAELQTRRFSLSSAVISGRKEIAQKLSSLASSLHVWDAV